MFSPSVTSGQCISSLILPQRHPTSQFWALMHRGRASSLTLLQCWSSPSSAHSWAHTGFALWAHPDIMMTSQSQTSRYAAATSPQFGCDSFPTSMALCLAKHAEKLGTRHYDCSLKEKTFLIFVPVLPVTGFRSSFQSKVIFKSQVLQKGWYCSL